MGKKKKELLENSHEVESFEDLPKEKQSDTSLKMVLNKDLIINLMTKDGTRLQKEFKKGDTVKSGKDIEESTFVKIKEHHSE